MSETARAIYERLSRDREIYLDRAEECAELTIPFLFPKRGANGTTKYKTPFQAVGARGVNNLASKLLLALFPPNTPFFRLDVKESVMQYLSSAPEEKHQIEQKLVQQEQVFQKFFESHQYRVTLNEAIKQLVVAGNGLLFLPPKEGGIRLYRLSSYVIQRDYLGNTIQLITCDKMAINTIPYEVLQQLDIDLSTKAGDELVEIYTHVTYSSRDKRYYSYQEIEGKHLEGYDQNYPADACPWIPLRLFKMDGEHYSRSYVEEYLGDLKTLEGLSKAIAEFSAITAHLVYLVNPNGVTQVSKISRARNGGFVPGRADDIMPLSSDKKTGDFQVTKATADAIETRLSYAFMLNSAVQRQAERVTAEEIRYVANELEDTLGGIYSILSQELQLPLVNVLMSILQKRGEMADMPKDVVQPAITTGVEAIGRGHDLTKLTMFMNLVSPSPEASRAVRWSTFCQAAANGCDLDTTGLIKTPEELAQEEQQLQMMQMMQAGIPNATKGVMDGINQQNGGAE